MNVVSMDAGTFARTAAITEQPPAFTPCMGRAIGDLGDGCAGVSVILLVNMTSHIFIPS
jgi:hypothetical protein